MKQNGLKFGFFQSTYKFMTIISINLYFPKYGVAIFFGFINLSNTIGLVNFICVH